MRLHAVMFMLLSGTLVSGADPAPGNKNTNPPALSSLPPNGKHTPLTGDPTIYSEAQRLFESDHAFDSFIGPITNPVLSKDPRALTEARLLFVNNWIPDQHPIQGGNLQAYGLQVRVAVTERLSIIADKDGYATIHPGAGPNTDGWLNMAIGLKYAIVRDPEEQLLVTAGFQFEPQSGEASVFQSQGDGLLSIFTSVGKGFCNGIHVIGNAGYQMPVDATENSSFFYSQLHLDKQMFGWLYPLVEVNWFHYTDGGNRGIPLAFGEGDGLINLGTTGIAGHDIVTAAVGLKAVLNKHLNAGVAYERPLSSRTDLIDHRIVGEVIFRY